jgi:oligopeptide transport system ATP-binding protein
MTPLLEARGLTKHFLMRRRPWQLHRQAFSAVKGVSLALQPGETLALVGESGSGKTTVARLVMRLLEPESGSLRFMGEDLLLLSGRELRRRRRHFQMVFQDPWGSLHPRMRVGDAIREPLAVHRLLPRGEHRQRVEELLGLVGLSPELAQRWPHELSGGQRQRVAIARALAPEPRLLVADEPTSALDVAIRAQIVNLLAGLQQRLGLALLFIGHDLALVEQIADRAAVMFRGEIVEEGPSGELLSAPRHPHTAALLAAVPRLPSPEDAAAP